MMEMEIFEDWTAETASETVLLCSARLGDVAFHAEAIRVKTFNGIQCGYDDVAQRRLDNMGAIDCGDGPFHTIKVPGYKGKWVLNILPGKD